MSERNPTDATLTVSQFGRLAQLSRKALRLYDAQGLLAPARVDAFTGYRYYARTQVAVARRIKLLRMMEMPLEGIAAVLAAWESDPPSAQRLIALHIHRLKEKHALAQTAMELLSAEFSPKKEIEMKFTFTNAEMPAQTVVSIQRRIRVPEFHQLIRPTLDALFEHIKASGAQAAGDPLTFYYGPVNENDDGPVEICVPFTGAAMPKGEIRVREVPAHKVVQVRTFGEYNEFPKLLEMWDALGQRVNQGGLESNWDGGLETYEIWHEGMSMTICWPVRAFEPAPEPA